MSKSVCSIQICKYVKSADDYSSMFYVNMIFKVY